MFIFIIIFPMAGKGINNKLYANNLDYQAKNLAIRKQSRNIYNICK